MDPIRASTAAPIQTLEAAQALASRAETLRTPCGDGDLLWHAWGKGDDAIVLLHGGSGSWTHWIRNIEPLVQSGRRVLVPDLPGSGDSAAPPSGDDADALPPWLESGLAGLIGCAPVDLVAFSFGGLVGTLLAAQHPARVRRLILVGAPALGIAAMRPVPLRAWTGEPPGPSRDAIHRHNLAVFMFSRSQSVDALAVRLHGDNVVRDRMVRRRLHQSDLLLRTLTLLRCPVWGIWGEDDALYRGRRGLIEEALPHAPGFRSLTFIPQAGHWAQYEDANAFNATLASALAEPVDTTPASAGHLSRRRAP